MYLMYLILKKTVFQKHTTSTKTSLHVTFFEKQKKRTFYKWNLIFPPVKPKLSHSNSSPFSRKSQDNKSNGLHSSEAAQPHVTS